MIWFYLKVHSLMILMIFMICQLSSYHFAVPHYRKIICPGVVNPDIYRGSSHYCVLLSIQTATLLVTSARVITHSVHKITQSRKHQNSNCIATSSSQCFLPPHATGEPSQRGPTPDPELTWHRSAAHHRNTRVRKQEEGCVLRNAKPEC